MIAWQKTDLNFTASEQHSWASFPLQVTFKCGAETLTLDGYWNGDQTWTVRFVPTQPGTWTWKSLSSDPGMDQQQGDIECIAPTAQQVIDNPNLRGFISVSEGARYFTYADGTPFFWLGDTVWAISTKRCGLGDNQDGPFFQWLRDRIDKGFTAACVQFFRRLSQSNEGGYPFPDNTNDNGSFESLNPEFFQSLDTRMEILWQSGLVVTAHPTWFGKPQGGPTNIAPQDAQLITRYLLARYSAYNIVYSLSGEYQHSYTDMTNPWTPEHWRELGAKVKSWNAYKHPVSVMSIGTDELNDPKELTNEAYQGSSAGEFHAEPWLDHNWIQTGHRSSLLWRIPQRTTENRAHEPAKPVVLGEGWYEGFDDPNSFVQCNAAHIRWQAWVSLLSGAAGYIYGHGDVWGYFSKLNDPMPDQVVDDQEFILERGFDAEGGNNLRHLRSLFDRIEWWKLEPGQNLLHTDGLFANEANEWYLRVPYCAAAPGELYVVYMPQGTGKKSKQLQLEGSHEYRAYWYNPRDGGEKLIDIQELYGSSTWTVPDTPGPLDWVLVVQKT